MGPDQSWAPDACTLPSAEQPLRVADFDALFRAGALRVDRAAGQELTVTLRPDPLVAAKAAELAVRETACCSFFRFDLAVADGAVTLRITAGSEHAATLDALADRARGLLVPPT